MNNKLLEKKLKLIYKIANNALYFNDRNDYARALYEICETIEESRIQKIHGEKYIETIDTLNIFE